MAQEDILNAAPAAPLVEPTAVPPSAQDDLVNKVLQQSNSGLTPQQQAQSTAKLEQLKTKEAEDRSIDILNPEGEVGKIPEDQLHDALGQGYKLPTPDKHEDVVRVKDKDGAIGSIPKDQLEDAIASGEYFPLNQFDKKVAQNLDYLKREGITGLADNTDGEQPGSHFGIPASVDVGIKGAIDAIPILGSYVKDKVAEDPAAEEALRQYQNLHSTAHTVGQVAGTGLTIYGTAGLGEAVGGLKAVQTLSPLARAAIEGAVWSAPDAVDDAIHGDYAGAAESLALGSLTNAGFHGLGKLAGAVKEKLTARAVEKAAEIAESGSKSFTAAENTFMKEVGVTPAKMKQIRPKISQLIESAGITGKDNAETAVQKILKLQDSGKLIGKAIEKLEAAPNKTESITEALFKTSDEITESLSKLIGVEKKQAEKALKPILQQINEVSKLPELGFTQTQGLKKFIGEQTDFMGKKLANRVKKEAYSIFTNNLKMAEDKAASALSDPSIIADLQKDRLAYSLRKVMGDFAEKAQSKEVIKTPLEKLGEMIPHGGHGGMLEGFVLHSILGLGGVPAMAAGAVLSKGASMFKHAAENRRFGEAIRILSKESTTPAADAVLASNKLISDELAAKAKAALSGIASKYKGPVAVRGINSYLQDNGVGKTKQAQISELKQMAALHRINPEAVKQHLAEVVQPLRDEGLDAIADQYTDHQIRLMKVIDTVLPKDPKMEISHPFAAEVKKKDISPHAMAQYEKAVHLASDPTHLFELIKNNTISQKDIAIVAATNPQTYQKMKNELLKEGMRARPNLSYQQRLSLSIFMGENIDASTKMIPQLQSVYMQQPQVAQPKTPKLSAKSADNISQSALTGSQKSSLQ